MIKGLTYAIVTTDDVPRARRFFTEKLGLGTEDDEGDTFSQFTTREGTLWAVMQAPPRRPSTASHSTSPSTTPTRRTRPGSHAASR